MNKFVSLIVLILSSFHLSLLYSQWEPDILGDGFQMRYIDQGKDYSGFVRSTIVRLRAENKSSKRGVLYIHGFNDYFFQKEMAEKFAHHDYNFYAVDLRKYGRSLMSGQKAYQVRNLKEYFPDIDSTLMIMKEEGIDSVVMMGHSTGGLIASYYMALNQPKDIDALILNSPFLDWNLGKLEIAVPFVSGFGYFFPCVNIPQGGSVYGESLDSHYHGEWNYNNEWKKHDSEVDAGWVRAIDKAQTYLKKHPFEIHVPILLMYSSSSYTKGEWSEEAQRSDAVLDVKDIKRYGLRLGDNVTPVKVTGGLHDLFLSSKNVRLPLYKYVFYWLSENF